MHSRFSGIEYRQVTNLSNISALVYHGLQSLERAKTKPVNWAGFYFTDPKDPNTLILGPFQGKIACTVIPFGKGVCGAAAATKQTQLVRDVHAFPGHIACDSASNSEIVVPLVLPSGRVIGVLDIDNEAIEGFDEDDKVGSIGDGDCGGKRLVVNYNKHKWSGKINKMSMCPVQFDTMDTVNFLCLLFSAWLVNTEYYK
ncbi:GAF domain-like protein [Jimgerdemannia flammicorona]|uniref:GAF domain-like protein n=1 Tax=Jimgerdemannia flammicorona TaxID=994334 RepID=A0A433DBS5_9FUNG|nr:GAF domain-like protein [Jimgerdemannia flammicorona]